MLKKYTIELVITLADGGSSAGDVIELYGTQIREDINQTAWNLCDCNDQLQSERFGDLVLNDWQVIRNSGENFQVKSRFTVNAKDESFINEVIVEYMDGFSDWITVTQNGLYSRTGERGIFNTNPLQWDVEIE